MNGRIEQEETSAKLSYSMADLDTFCDELGDQLYELVFKNVFKNNRDNFDATLKLTISSHKSLVAIIAKYVDTSATISEINDKLDEPVKKAIKEGTMRVPDDQDERNRLARVLGNYFRLQLSIAQFKYFYLNYIYQDDYHNKEQTILAAKKIKDILPKLMSRTADAATDKHSFSFFGLQIIKRYDADAASLREKHDNLNAQCEKLLAFIDSVIPQNPSNNIPAAEVLPDAEKTKTRKAKKRIVSAEEIELDKDDMQKKQAAIPAAFQDEKTLPLHPVLEQALDVQKEAGKDLSQAKKLFSSINLDMVAREKAEKEAAMQQYFKELAESQKHFDAMLAVKKKPGFLQSLKTSFLNFISLVKKAINIMIVIILDELPKKKKIEKSTSVYKGKGSMAETIEEIAENGGNKTFNPATLTIEEVIRNTKEAAALAEQQKHDLAQAPRDAGGMAPT